MAETALLPVTLTDAGITAAFAEHNKGLGIRISHIAIGDGNGIGYTPNQTATALRNERARVAVGNGEQTGANEVLLQAAFRDIEASFFITELAIILEDGTVFAIWSDPVTPLTAATPNSVTVIAHTLRFDALPPGSVSVVSVQPDLNIVFDDEFALIIANQARITRQQFHQAEAHYAEHGQYPGDY